MYCGRFAPTPSGPLHLGSLLTALAGWLQARHHRGLWRLRLDDLDRPRCVPGAELRIQQQLREHGLVWDGEPVRQSAHLPRYRLALEELVARGCTYRCSCTRKQLRRSRHEGPDGSVYAGTCRARKLARGAVRVALPGDPVKLEEAGRTMSRGPLEIGDPLVQRAGGEICYVLASVVDETELGVTEIVRGGDLLASSFQQQALRSLLQHSSPLHFHLPVLTDRAGRKLSKQNHAPALEPGRELENLQRCLRWLGQEPDSCAQDVSALLGTAVER